MYDNICKFLVEEFPEDLATWLVGKPVTLTKLNPRELSLEPIRTDSLILLQSDRLILHGEFQTKPHKAIPFRMADYRLRGYRFDPDKEMKQVVIYLKKTASELVYQNTFQLGKLSHSFDIVRLWEQPTKLFLDTPGLLPFAILSKEAAKADVLREVSKKVETIEDRRMQANIAASASILAGLVLDNEIITRLMRREIMRESVVYQEIRKEALDEGRQEGRQEGLIQGKEAVAWNLLQAGMTVEQVVDFTDLSVDLVRQLTGRKDN